MSGNLRAENYRDRQDSSLVKEDSGSPDSSADSQREQFRLRKLLVGDKSKHCNKVACSIYLNVILISMSCYDLFGLNFLVRGACTSS